MSDYNPWYDPTEEIKAQTERENIRIKARMKLTHADDGNDYGRCSCGADLEPVWFEEQEWKAGVYTGRVRVNMNYLICPRCMKKECVDGETFAGPWHYKK